MPRISELERIGAFAERELECIGAGTTAVAAKKQDRH